MRKAGIQENEEVETGRRFGRKMWGRKITGISV
jgi:hypothetical protein